MAEPLRYSVSRKGAGLKGEILKNKPGIRNRKMLEDAETVLLTDTYEHFFDLLQKGKISFGLPLLFQIHHYFLSPLYSWAGKTRSVDISKDGMMFCPAIHIQKNLEGFEKILKKNFPDKKEPKKRIAQKLAIIHNELNAIHPFREGNGRVLRLFIDLMAASMNYGPIDYHKSGRGKYLRACKAGMNLDHKKMEEIFYSGLSKKAVKPV